MFAWLWKREKINHANQFEQTENAKYLVGQFEFGEITRKKNLVSDSEIIILVSADVCVYCTFMTTSIMNLPKKIDSSE